MLQQCKCVSVKNVTRKKESHGCKIFISESIHVQAIDPCAIDRDGHRYLQRYRRWNFFLRLSVRVLATGCRGRERTQRQNRGGAKTSREFRSENRQCVCSSLRDSNSWTLASGCTDMDLSASGKFSWPTLVRSQLTSNSKVLSADLLMLACCPGQPLP